MVPRPPDEDLTQVESTSQLESLAQRVSVLQRENAEFASSNEVLQLNTAISMTQRGDLEAHLKRLGEAVLGMLTVLSNNSLIVVKDGLIVPEHVDLQGLRPPDASAEIQEAKRQLEQEVMMLRKEFNAIKMTHQRASCDQQDKDRHIGNLTNQIKNQKELLLKINNEQIKLRADHTKTEEELKVVEDRCNTLNSEKTNLEVTLNELTRVLQHEQSLRADILSEKTKAEAEFKKIKATVAELQKKNFDLESWISQQSRLNSNLAINVHGEHIDMAKLMGFKVQQPSRESCIMEIHNDTMDSGFMDFHNTTQDSIRSQRDTKPHSLAATDKYYDYSGPQSDIMKKLSMESLSRYLSYIDS